MFFRLLLLFTLVPVLELYLLIKVGSFIGALTTILIVIGTGVLGAALARQQGFQVMRSLQSEFAEGKLPATRMIEGLLLLIGGFTLLTPGFVTDFLGFCMLLPPTRKLVALWLQNSFKKAIAEGTIQVVSSGSGSATFFSSSSFSSRSTEKKTRVDSDGVIDITPE